MRGLQVARGLFLQQFQQLAAGAAALSDDTALLKVQAASPASARQRLASCRCRSRTRCSKRRRDRPSRRALHARQLRGCAQRRGRARWSRPIVARHPGRVAYERTGQRRAGPRSARGARGAAPGRPGDADARGRDCDRGDRRDLVDKLKAALGAGREVVVYAASDPGTRRRSWPRRRAAGGAAAAHRLQRRQPGHRADSRSPRGREPPLFGRARSVEGCDRARCRSAWRRRRSRAAGRRPPARQHRPDPGRAVGAAARDGAVEPARAAHDHSSTTHRTCSIWSRAWRTSPRLPGPPPDRGVPMCSMRAWIEKARRPAPPRPRRRPPPE